jgi:hypothetical protein
LFKCIVFDINKIRKDFKKRANKNINEIEFSSTSSKDNKKTEKENEENKIKPNEAIIIPGIKLEQNVSNNIEDKIPINKIKNIRDD